MRTTTSYRGSWNSRRFSTRGTSEFEEEKRNDIYWDAAVIHYEEAYNIPLFNLSHLHGARKDISYQGWLNADPGLNPRYLGVST